MRRDQAQQGLPVFGTYLKSFGIGFERPVKLLATEELPSGVLEGFGCVRPEPFAQESFREL